jgi:hypothetical protein
VLNGEPIEEHGNQKDEHDHRDDHNGWACSRLRLFLDDGHVRIVPRPLEGKQRFTSVARPFLTDL